MATKNRSELKAYFVKNAIPTEANFAELIDAQLNQSDDGVFKLGDDPLSVVAAPGDQKRVLRFYEQYPAQNPAWTLSLMPRTDPADAKTAARGLGFDAPDGSNKLFLSADGKLGVGTTSPREKLTVSGGDVSIEGGDYRRLKIISDSYWAGIELVARNAGRGGHPHIDFTHGDLDSPNYGVRLYSNANGKLVIDGGSLGIGTDPLQPLDVSGNANLRGRTWVGNGLVLSGGDGAHIDADGALYKKDNDVWLTVDNKFHIRDKGNDSWALRINTDGGSLEAQGGIVAGVADRSGHINTDGALYRKNSTMWLTLEDDLYFRKPNDGDNWGLRLHHNGHIETKNCLIFGSGDRDSHVNADGALYRYGGQAWLVVDDNFYIRDTSHTGDSRSFWFDTNNSNLHIAGDLKVNGGDITLSDSWTITSSGDHMYIKKGSKTVARFSVSRDRFQVYRKLDGASPYFYYNEDGNHN